MSTSLFKVWGYTCSNASLDPVHAQALEGIRSVIKNPTKNSAPGQMAPMTMRESSFAVKPGPIKVHKRRRSQTEAYHRRVQKKWTKRHGVRQVPCVYVVDNASFGGSGCTMYAHPSLMQELLRSFT